MSQPIPITPDTPEVCPVCQGHGIMPHGFFEHPAGVSFGSTSCENVKCRPCDGTGILWPARHAPQAPAVSDTEIVEWLEGNTVELYCAGLYDGTHAAVICRGKTFKGATLRSAILAAMKGEREGKK